MQLDVVEECNYVVGMLEREFGKVVMLFSTHLTNNGHISSLIFISSMSISICSYFGLKHIVLNIVQVFYLVVDVLILIFTMNVISCSCK
jgi:hypothetical protein